MPYKIELGPDGSPNQTLTASDVVEVDIAKPHTAVADFDAEIPWSRSIKDRVLDRCRIYSNGTLLFDGYLKELDWNQERGRVRLNGPGIGDDLRDSAIERSWQNIATHEAIRQTWDNDTNFSATVRDPQVSEIVTDKVIADASQTSGLAALFSATPSTAPFYATSDEIRLAQSLFMGEDDFGTGEFADTWVAGEIINSSGEVKGGYIGGSFGNSGDSLTFSFTPNYDIPAEHLNFGVRIYPFDDNGDGDTLELPQMEYRVDGTSVQGFVDKWGIGSNVSVPYWDTVSAGDAGTLKAGNTYTAGVYQTKDSDSTYDELWTGKMVVYDDRWSYNFDNTVSTTGTGDTGDYNYLDGPELYPNAAQLVFDQIEADFNVIGITLSTSGWNDTGGDQQVAVSFDGGSTWFTADNATSIDENQPSNVGATVDYRVTMDRYGSGRQRTPDQGYLGQSLGSITVDYDGSDLSIIQDNTFRGSPLKILKDLHQKAGYRFVIDHAAGSKTVESFQTGTITKSKDFSVLNRSPRLSFTQYANEITVYGALADDGTRPKVVVEDTDEVNTYGREPYFEVRPDLTTVDQVRSAAIDLLSDKVTARDQKGTVTALPTTTLPGYSYPVDWFVDGNPTETPLERVQFREAEDQLRGTLKFTTEEDVTETVIEQGRTVDTVTSAV